MEKISNSNHIFYAGHNYPIVQNRVYIVDSAGTIVGEHLPNDYKGLMMPVIERNFFRSNNEVSFREAFNPNVYKVTDNKIEEKYKFDFGQYDIPSKFWEIDITEDFPIISSHGFAIVEKYYESNRYSFFTSLIQKENNVDSYHIILDKQDSSIHKKSIEDDRFGDVFRWPIGFDESTLIFAVTPPYLIDNIEELNLDDTLLKNVHFERNDNPILVFCNINQIVE